MLFLFFIISLWILWSLCYISSDSVIWYICIYNNYYLIVDYIHYQNCPSLSSILSDIISVTWFYSMISMVYNIFYNSVIHFRFQFVFLELYPPFSYHSFYSIVWSFVFVVSMCSSNISFLIRNVCIIHEFFRILYLYSLCLVFLFLDFLSFSSYRISQSCSLHLSLMSKRNSTYVVWIILCILLTLYLFKSASLK